MSNQVVVVYIPHVFPCGNWQEFGGAPGMKKYLRKAFSGHEEGSSVMKIGTVKHVDIVLNKKTSSMLNDYCAFVRFMPSNSEYCAKILSTITKDDKFRFFHNQSRGFYWDFYLSDRDAVKQVQDRAVQTVQVATNVSSATKSDPTDSLDSLCHRIGELHCDGRPTKRQRMEV
jgi:hypothetical protein